MKISRRIAVLIALMCACGCLSAYPGVSAPVARASADAAPYGALPRGLPRHVLIGLSNDPGNLNWMTGSKVRWDARYQYLSGGVNTGSGWATWNKPAGAFALWYMQASAAHGYLPVFTYYQLGQSAPQNGTSQSDQDLRNLANRATMRAYYADFKLLMDQAHTYGKPVIVQVEPDLWGFIEQNSVKHCGTARCVPAAVASSGYRAVSAYPNTAQGFAEALLHLRDLYARNVIMAIHASCWGSGADVCGAPTSTPDTASHARIDAYFLASAGIKGNRKGTSSWDLVFTDPSDRDAAYIQYVYGNGGAWWDPTNRALPDFDNYADWLSHINRGTGRRIVLWQVPIGNQYYRTENNTNDHYQDNRAQYFLGDGPRYDHLRAFAAAGVVGLLFGRGADGPTSYDDARHDGITNPPPVVSFQCDKCNTHVSRYPDDDGGYLRLFAGAYLRRGGVSVE